MEKIEQNATKPDTVAFLSLIRHPLTFKLYLLKNLPAAFFSGVRLVELTGGACTASVPYKHFTRNPFRSTYFACLSMAAELSTGVLVLANIHGRKPAISMLITGMEAKFYKKAKEVTFFTCSDGDTISTAIGNAISLNLSQEVKVHSIGKNPAGEVIAEFWFNWSFKAK